MRNIIMKYAVRLTSVICALIVLGALYTRWIEPVWLEKSVHTITLPGKTGETIRVVHLSDLHASSVVSFDFLNKAVDEVISSKPDLIVLTGDYVTSPPPRDYKNTETFKTYQSVLRRLAAVAPTFACLGNHDGGVWAGYDSAILNDFFTASGITVLRNQTTGLIVKNRKVELIGLGDLWAEELRPQQAFAGIDKNEKDVIRFVLVHNPDAKEQLIDFPWDIMFSGHTHGGQLKLPIIGTPFAPVKDQGFVEGLHAWEGRFIYITRGVGNLHGMRFNCRPEVSLLLVQ